MMVPSAPAAAASAGYCTSSPETRTGRVILSVNSSPTTGGGAGGGAGAGVGAGARSDDGRWFGRSRDRGLGRSERRSRGCRCRLGCHGRGLRERDLDFFARVHLRGHRLGSGPAESRPDESRAGSRLDAPRCGAARGERVARERRLTHGDRRRTRRDPAGASTCHRTARTPRPPLHGASTGSSLAAGLLQQRQRARLGGLLVEHELGEAVARSRSPAASACWAAASRAPTSASSESSAMATLVLGSFGSSCLALATSSAAGPNFCSPRRRRASSV